MDVIFRVWKDEEKTVFALFPGVAGTMNAHTCQCYEKQGEHGSADLAGCLARSRSATEDEAAPLMATLRRIGYTVRAVPWPTYAHNAARVDQTQRQKTRK